MTKRTLDCGISWSRFHGSPLTDHHECPRLLVHTSSQRLSVHTRPQSFVLFREVPVDEQVLRSRQTCCDTTTAHVAPADQDSLPRSLNIFGFKPHHAAIGDSSVLRRIPSSRRNVTLRLICSVWSPSTSPNRSEYIRDSSVLRRIPSILLNIALCQFCPCGFRQLCSTLCSPSGTQAFYGESLPKTSQHHLTDFIHLELQWPPASYHSPIGTQAFYGESRPKTSMPWSVIIIKE